MLPATRRAQFPTEANEGRPGRIATSGQDGTLRVEHPMYSQVMYCLDRVPEVVKAKPEFTGDRQMLEYTGAGDLHG